MTRRCFYALTALLAASLAYSDEPLRKSGFTWTWLPKCALKCPDDYCAKRLPCTPLVQPRGLNDYCAKRLPPPPIPVTCKGPNDYDSKKPTLMLGTPPWYICVPAVRP